MFKNNELIDACNENRRIKIGYTASYFAKNVTEILKETKDYITTDVTYDNGKVYYTYAYPLFTAMEESTVIYYENIIPKVSSIIESPEQLELGI